MKRVRIDGVDCEVDDLVAAHIAALTKRADELDAKARELEKAAADGKAERSRLEAERSRLEAERDTASGRADRAEAELERVREEAADEARIDEAVKERLAVYGAADMAGVEVKDGMKMDDVRRAVVAAVFPDVKLDGKDAVYVTACFDAAQNALARQADEAGRKVMADGVSGGQKCDAASARERMIELNRRLSLGGKED